MIVELASAVEADVVTDRQSKRLTKLVDTKANDVLPASTDAVYIQMGLYRVAAGLFAIAEALEDIRVHGVTQR